MLRRPQVAPGPVESEAQRARRQRLAQMAANACEALGADFAAIAEMARDASSLRFVPPPGERFAPELSRFVIQDLQSSLRSQPHLCAEDIAQYNDPLPPELADELRLLGCRSASLSFVAAGPSADLLLLLGWPRTNAPDVERLAPCATLLRQGLLAEDERERADGLAHELQRSRDQLRCLLEIGSGLLGELDLRELFVKLSRQQMGRNLRHDVSGVALLEPDGAALRLYALDLADASSPAYDPELLIPADGSPEGWVCRHRKVLRLASLEHERHRFPTVFFEHLRRERIASATWAPLTTRNRVLGAFMVGVRASNDASDELLDFIQQIANQIAVAIENASAYQQIAQLRDRLAEEKHYLEDELRGELNFDEIVGSSPAMQSVRQQLAVVAPTDSTVLLLGESGVGKEMLARAIHAASPRRSATFVRVNCPAIPSGLLESELFGHERGAFTGAISRKLGRAELANGGVLFLDEIGDLPLELQPKLLRLLQEHEFERLGSAQPRRADARIIAATNRDLSAMVSAGLFRQDLFYRLNVFPLRVPPLRERREEIPELARFFAQKHSRRLHRPIDEIAPEAMRALVDWPWPGNVRELENLIERAVLLNGERRVLRLPAGELSTPPASAPSAPAPLAASAPLADAPLAAPTTPAPLSAPEPLAAPTSAPLPSAPSAPEPPSNLPERWRRLQRQQILSALDQCSGRVSGPHGAAALLGLPRSTLVSRMRSLGLSAHPQD